MPSSKEKHEKLKILTIKQGVEEKYKVHPDAKFCGNFNMNQSEVRHFFALSVSITTNEQHYQYAWSPCFVVVSIEENNKKFQWQIFASGVARMIGNKKNVLGCEKCGKPFFKF